MIQRHHIAPAVNAAMLLAATSLSACISIPLPTRGTAAQDEGTVIDVALPSVSATVETVPVRSTEDAADDPAIWVHPEEGQKSLVLGTDKRNGLHVYNLEGGEVQFLPLPEPNNVDIRQNIPVTVQMIEQPDGSQQPTVMETADIAVTSNRGDNSVSVLSVFENGVEEVHRFATVREAPYGICLGLTPLPLVAVTHKSGMIDFYAIELEANVISAMPVNSLDLGTQLEGCVFDEANGALFVGKEDVGIVGMSISAALRGNPPIRDIDLVDGVTGITGDIEGLTIYETGAQSGYLLASSQGNNSFAVYDRQTFSFLGRFAIVDGEVTLPAPERDEEAEEGAETPEPITKTIDGAEETDGIAASSARMGDAFPRGMLVVQDGVNDDGAQNFKYVPWGRVARRLGLL